MQVSTPIDASENGLERNEGNNAPASWTYLWVSRERISFQDRPHWAIGSWSEIPWLRWPNLKKSQEVVGPKVSKATIHEISVSIQASHRLVQSTTTMTSTTVNFRGVALDSRVHQIRLGRMMNGLLPKKQENLMENSDLENWPCNDAFWGFEPR